MKRTISVLVIKLAIPKPWGIRSIHRWKGEEFSFQKLASILARIVIAEDTKVNVYNFPVRRMSLGSQEEFRRCFVINAHSTYHPAKTLPIEIAT